MPGMLSVVITAVCILIFVRRTNSAIDFLSPGLFILGFDLQAPAVPGKPFEVMALLAFIIFEFSHSDKPAFLYHSARLSSLPQVLVKSLPHRIHQDTP